MIITHKINMSLTRRGIPELVTVMQDDQYSRNVEFTLTANGTAWAVPENTTAVIRYCRPDGSGGSYDALPDDSAAYSYSGNVLTVALAPAVCALPGLVRLAVGLIDGDTEVNTFAIDLLVERNPGLEVTDTGDYRVRGTVADSGWEGNMYLGTDEDGNVVAVQAPEGGSCGCSAEIKAISVTEAADGTVTMVNTLEDGTETIVLTPDDSGNPATMTYNGTEIPITYVVETEETTE